MTDKNKHLYSFDPFLLDTGESVLKRGSSPIPLGPQEFATLVFMVKNRGHLLRREEFGNQIWPDTNVKQRTGLDRIISNIRKALEEFGDKYIETVPKRGYRFVAKVADLLADIPDEACPWVGLESFDEKHAEIFYGREDETEILATRLRESKFIALVGASGTGKSSLARAGLVPAIRNITADGQRWDVKVFRPSNSPFNRLASVLMEASAEPASNKEIEDLAERLRESPTSLITHIRSAHAGTASPVLLLIDQFEEVFTSSNGPVEENSFIANIVSLVSSPDPNILVVLTLRTDFLARLEKEYPELWHFVSEHLYWVRELSIENLRRAIEEPVQRVGLELDDGLVGEILKDLEGSSAALPLLSHTMAELFMRRQGRRLTFRAYQEVGRVQGAISHHANAVFERLSTAEQPIARRLLIMLTGVGPKPENDVRRRLPFEDLMSGAGESLEVSRVVRELTYERLLTTSTSKEPSGSDDGAWHTWVEISHEALIQNWPRLAVWLNQKRHSLHVFNRLDSAAREWGESKESGLLYRGHTLESALEEREGYWEFTSDVHKEFLRLSEKAERRRKITKGILIVAGLTLCFGVIAFWFRWRNTSEQRDLANSLRRAADSISQISYDPELSLLLAVESANLTMTKQTESALRQALAASHVRAVYRGHQSQVISVDRSPDGRFLLTAGLDQEALIWDIVTGQVVSRFGGHAEGISWADYSPDGNRIVTASVDGAVRVWEVSTGRLINELRGHTEPNKQAVNHAIFSPDGSSVVEAGEDGVALIWDLQTGKVRGKLTGHTQFINTVAYSPDGKFIATASGDSTARIWDATTTDQVAILKGHRSTLLNVAFSADSKRIVTASSDRTARIWKVGEWTEELLISGHSLQVNSAVFSPNGRFILTSSKDGTARIWDANTGKELLQLLGHTSAINTAIFSADGREVYTASGDFTVRRWEIPSTKTQTTIQSPSGAIYSVAFSPDGRRVVTGDGNAAVVWDVTTGNEIKSLPHPSAVRDAVFSTDGKIIATAGDDGIGRIWDLNSGGQPRELTGHEGTIYSIALNADGRLALTAGKDKTFRIWELNTGRNIKTFSDNGGEVYRASFSPDGNLVATAGQDRKVRVWSISTDKKLFEWNVKTREITSVTFSPDGKNVLAACLDGTARVWSLSEDGESGSSDKAVVVLRGHDKGLNSAEFSPDGLIIMTASDDHTVRLWELGTGRTLFQLTDHYAPIKRAAFSPNGRLLAVADTLGKVGVYSCDICGATGEELLKLAKNRKLRDLTIGERARFLTLTK
jgi:WD40 repeat protein/DNA-binding winged helix-turn-helix (wHTH) protein